MSSVATLRSDHRSTLHPFHVILLAGTIPLFLGGLLNDIAYSKTYQVQWSNFASWLIAGGLLFGGLALLFALIALIRADKKSGRPVMYFTLLLVTWILGLVNAFEHAKDALASMPSGLIMSIVVTVLACITTWIGLGNTHHTTLVSTHSGETK